jgi:ubiquinone/menaquinone biosynthesis C-methylase UbiE
VSELHRANVDNLPYGDGEFTKIRTVNTIYFCPTPSAALAEMCRVLRAGRKLIVSLDPSRHRAEEPYTSARCTAQQSHRLSIGSVLC